MVYLFFEGEKTADGKEIITLIDKKVSDGFFKNEEFGTAKDITNTFYKIVLFDRNNQVYKTANIDNPFSPVFESYGQESMEKQIGQLNKAEFFTVTMTMAISQNWKSIKQKMIALPYFSL
jgi:hypothetical protein